MCRKPLTDIDIKSCKKYKYQIEGWILNPETKRYVKSGSRTHKYLIENGILK
jgi:hypothetical protein